MRRSPSPGTPRYEAAGSLPAKETRTPALGSARWGPAILALLLAAGPAPGARRAAAGEDPPTRETPATRGDSRLDVREIAPHVLLHTSYRDLEGIGPFPSNGLLLCRPGEGGVVDTAWSEAATERLLDEAAARGCPVKRAVVTHFHDDRTAGIPVLNRRGIAVHATAETARRLARPEWKTETVAAPQRLRLGGLEVEVFHPGPAHTADNVVVHVAAARVLFGGCAIKAASATGMGNVADAALDAWPAALERIAARFGRETAIVAPGHGEAGDLGLLAHTRELLSAAVTPR